MSSPEPAVTSLATPPPGPAVEAEECLYEYLPANNGAGPLWCYGSTCQRIIS
jgi:hypothetical protein